MVDPFLRPMRGRQQPGLLALTTGAAAVVLLVRLRCGELPSTLALMVRHAWTLQSAGYEEPGAFVQAITAHNEYTPLMGFAGQGYPFLREGALVEPYRPTTLSATLPAGQSVVSYAWRIVAPTDEVELRVQSDVPIVATSATTAVSIAVDHLFRQLGDYTVELNATVRAWGSSTPRPASVTQALASYYVRRSIYALTDDDRDRFLDAFDVLGRRSRAEIAAAYGPDCHPLAYFVDAHLQLAGGRVADKLHDGMGFLTQHAALTNELELSLQKVDAVVTVPYWDYTYEGGLVKKHQSLAAAWSTKLWTDAWFGRADGVLHTVTRGRFAYQTVPRSGGNSTGTIRNPYGYLRAPWNVNKLPFVTRVHRFCNVSLGYDIWPSCATHYNLTFEPQSGAFYNWIWKASYAPHGPIHYFIGGYTNCGPLGEELANVTGADALESFARMMVVLPKQLYRDFKLDSPTCSADTPQNECHLICATDERKPGQVARFVDSVVELVEGLATTGLEVDYTWLQTLDEHRAQRLVRLLCTTPWSPGEQLEAASPVDVSFWPIHPTVERLLQYKRIVDDFDVTVWANPLPEEPTMFCQEGVTTRAAERRGDVDRCQGHHAVDLVIYPQLVKQQRGYAKEALTNAEFLASLDPYDYRLPYVYDNFRWTHCEEEGVFFPTPAWVTT